MKHIQRVVEFLIDSICSKRHDNDENETLLLKNEIEAASSLQMREKPHL